MADLTYKNLKEMLNDQYDEILRDKCYDIKDRILVKERELKNLKEKVK